MRSHFLFALCIGISMPAFAQQTPQQFADAELPSLLTIYKDIHTHPELSTQEQRILALLAKELKAAGCDVTENVGQIRKRRSEMLWRCRPDEKWRRAGRAGPH